MKRCIWFLLILFFLQGSAQAVQIEMWTWYDGVMGGIIRRLIAEEFTPKTGIEVEIVSVPISNEHFTKLLLSVISGDPPDVVEIYNNQSMELGMRQALTNMRSFPDIDEVLARFNPGLITGVSYKNGVFALPSEVGWFVTYYRTDLFGDMGIEAPVTWDDFTSVMTRLQARGLSTYWDFAGDRPITNKFLPLVYQRGEDIYNEDGNGSTLDAPASVSAFRMFTSLYTQYNMDLENPIWTTFANGSTPLAILQPWHYSVMERTAPQISGQWDITLFPGTMGPDGRINHTTTGTSLTWGITDKSTKKEAAWTLVKWLTSPEFLQLYSKAVYESPEAWRLIFATQGVLSTALFPEKHLEVLTTGLSQARSQRPVVGAYIADRYIEFAFNRVVIGGDDPDVAIRQAARESTTEIQNKHREFARFIQAMP